MKVALKWIIFLISILIFLYAFSSSYSSESIDHLDYIIAIGIDSVENSDNFEYSFEFANISSFSENASSEDSKPIVNKVLAPSISGAINIMNSYVGKQINLSHCKVIIFSDTVAQKGIISDVASLMNDTQIRPTVNVLVSEVEANKYIEGSVSSLEKVLTKYYDIFPTSSEYTGYTSNITLEEFYNNLTNENTGAVAILGRTVKSSKEEEQSSSDSGGSSSTSSSSSESEKSNQSQESNSTQDESQGKNQEQSQGQGEQQQQNQEQSQGQDEQQQQNHGQNQEQAQEQQNQQQNQNGTSHENPSETTSQGQSVLEGDRGTENIGLCVFKDDKDIGHLTAIETLCYSMIIDEVDNFYVRLDSPYNESQKIDVSIDALSSTKISVDTSKENPIIKIKLNLTGETLNGLDSLDYSDTKVLNDINDNLKQYLSKEVLNYLNKTSKEFKVDINGFYKKARKHFLTLKDFKDYNWAQKYENAEFDVEVNSDIISSRLIQNS